MNMALKEMIEIVKRIGELQQKLKLLEELQNSKDEMWAEHENLLKKLKTYAK